MFKSKEHNAVMDKLNLIHDMFAAHHQRLISIEDRITAIEDKLENDEEEISKDNSTEISELKADVRKNNEFIQNLLLMFVERQAELPNGKTMLKEAVRLRNASSTVGPAGKLPG